MKVDEMINSEFSTSLLPSLLTNLILGKTSYCEIVKLCLQIGELIASYQLWHFLLPVTHQTHSSTPELCVYISVCATVALKTAEATYRDQQRLSPHRSEARGSAGLSILFY